MVVPSVVEVRQHISRAHELVHAVPGRLDVTHECLRAAASRLDSATTLDARELEVRQASTDVTAALDEFFRTHTSGLGDALATLAATPRRATLELANEQVTLATARNTLARTNESLFALETQAVELGTRIAAGINRQLANHTLNYPRAVARIVAESRAGLDRREARHRELIAREAELLRAGANDRLDSATRNVVHLAEVTAARDFPRRSWLLATKSGESVRSAADLTAGDHVDLQLSDGSAEAVVEQVNSRPAGSAML